MVMRNRQQRITQFTSQDNTRHAILLKCIVPMTLLKVSLRGQLLTQVRLLFKHHHQIFLHYAREYHDRTMGNRKKDGSSNETRLVYDVFGYTAVFYANCHSLIQHFIYRSVVATLRFEERSNGHLWDLCLL